MLGSSLRNPKDATLLSRPDYTSHIQGQPYQIVHDAARVVELVARKIGTFVVSIRHIFHTTEGRERTGYL